MKSLKPSAYRVITEDDYLAFEVQKRVNSHLKKVWWLASPIGVLLVAGASFFGITSVKDFYENREKINQELAKLKNDSLELEKQRNDILQKIQAAEARYNATIAASERFQETQQQFMRDEKQVSQSYLAQMESNLTELKQQKANLDTSILNARNLEEDIKKSAEKADGDVLSATLQLMENEDELAKKRALYLNEARKLVNSRTESVIMGSGEDRYFEMTWIPLANADGSGEAKPQTWKFIIKTWKAHEGESFGIASSASDDPTGEPPQCYAYALRQSDTPYKIHGAPFAYTVPFAYRGKFGNFGPHRFVEISIIPIPLNKPDEDTTNPCPANKQKR
jgi:hypothetical protein